MDYIIKIYKGKNKFVDIIGLKKSERMKDIQEFV
jgi:hypothetical protein